MRLILSPILAIHWMAIFAMLAIASVIDPERGSFSALELLGVGVAVAMPDTGTSVMPLFPLGFAVVAALFLWTLIVALLGSNARRDTEEVSRIAFAGGVVALTMLLLAGAVQQVDGLFVAVGTLMAALLVSYLAVFTERWSVLAVDESMPEIGMARRMAQGAAHNAMLSRLSGRSPSNGKEGRP